MEVLLGVFTDRVYYLIENTRRQLPLLPIERHLDERTGIELHQSLSSSERLELEIGNVSPPTPSRSTRQSRNPPSINVTCPSVDFPEDFGGDSIE
jgi:hypothetical protein